MEGRGHVRSSTPLITHGYIPLQEGFLILDVCTSTTKRAIPHLQGRPVASPFSFAFISSERRDSCAVYFKY